MNRSVNQDKTPEPVVEEVEEDEVVEEELPQEVVAEALMSLNDVKDRFVGIVDNARAAGLASVASRGFAALEGFLGALAGDKEGKRPKR